jgi:hypothetical protein
MRRRDAARLFSEICQCIPDASINGLSLSPTPSSKEEFDLRINVFLDDKSLMDVQSIVNKRGMILKEEPGFLLIQGSRLKPYEKPMIV